MDEMNTEIIRQKPFDRDAERSVLGAMILNPETITVASEIISPADFYLKENQILFESVMELYNAGSSVDPVILVNKLREKGMREDVADTSYIAGLAAEVNFSENIRDYAKIVWEKSMFRKLIEASEKVSSECYKGTDSLETIMENTEKSVFSVLQNASVSRSRTIDKIAMDVFKNIQAASGRKGRVTGLASGYYELDYKTAGFQKSNLILVAARPAVGKTAFVLNIAEHVAVKKNIPVAFFSLEMSGEELVKRLMSIHSNIDAGNLRTGNLNDEEWEKLIEATTAVAKSNLFIEDAAGVSIAELRSRCRRLKLEHDVQLIVVDYLQLMSGGKRSESRQQEISEISRSLKLLAKELDIPIIALSQLSRAVEARPDKRPMLSDLRESGAIEQDADIVMFIYRDEVYNKDTKEPGVAEIIIGKQRSGATGTIKLSWLSQYTKFSNFETEY